MIHLTVTGPNAGSAICQIVALDRVPSFGMIPHPNPEDTGVHFAYAPVHMVNGDDPRVCRDCVRTFLEILT